MCAAKSHQHCQSHREDLNKLCYVEIEYSPVESKSTLKSHREDLNKLCYVEIEYSPVESKSTLKCQQRSFGTMRKKTTRLWTNYPWILLRTVVQGPSVSKTTHG